MKLKIQTDFSTVVVFFENIIDIINSAIVGKHYNDETTNFLNDMLNIVNETTGIIVLPKYRNEAMFLEASNLRTLETAFFIASNSHEISEAAFMDPEAIKEKYEESVKELCEKSKLSKFETTFGWNEVHFTDDDDAFILFSIKFDLPIETEQKCYSNLNVYLNEKLKLDWRS